MSPPELSGVIVNAFPLQIIAVLSLIFGVWLIIISATLDVISVHPPDENVTTT